MLPSERQEEGLHQEHPHVSTLILDFPATIQKSEILPFVTLWIDLEQACPTRSPWAAGAQGGFECSPTQISKLS